MRIDQSTTSAPSRRALLGLGCAGVIAGIAAPAIAKRAAPLKVAGVYTVPVQQRWVAAVHGALLNSVRRGDISYEFRDNVDARDFEFAIVESSESDADLIVGDAFAHEQRSRVAANRFPGKSYLMGSAFKSDTRFSNFAVFDNYIQDASYLTGIIAAGLSSNGVLGIIGRHNFPGVNRLINAFMDGASEVRSDINFLIDYIDSWHDLEMARNLAREQISIGADVLYADAFGPAEVAHDAGIPVIGTVSDAHPGGERSVVTSAVWHFGPTLELAIKRFKMGKFGAADYGIYSHMSHGGCALSPIGAFADRIPESTMELVALREGQIRSSNFAAKIDGRDPVARLAATEEGI